MVEFFLPYLAAKVAVDRGINAWTHYKVLRSAERDSGAR